MDTKENNKGITLVSLIVTVIVLIILASITLVTLVGENSLIFRAKEAKKDTERDLIQRKVEMIALKSYGPDGYLNVEEFKENIHIEIPEAIVEGDKCPITVTVDDNVIIIDDEGDVDIPTNNFIVTLSQDTYIYDGTEKRPEVTVKDGDKILVEGTDYTVKYINNINVGTATVVVTGQGDYDAIKKVNFTIKPAKMATVTTNNRTYNGQTQIGVTGSNIVYEGTKEAIDAGKYTVTVKPITDYTWADGTTEAKTIEWEIVAKSISVEWESKTIFLYNGKEQAPSASATSGVSGEVINIERTTAIEAGEHTSTASISSVTGGRAKKENYILIGNTKQYEINGYSYTIKYNGNGATEGLTEDSEHLYGEEKALTSNGYIREYTVTYNHNYSESTDTNRTATYTFNGWATTAEGEKVYDNNQKVINIGTSNGEIVNLYANWSSSSVSYKPTRIGYTFTGWYKEAECTNRVSDGNSYTPTEDVTLYAGWMANTQMITYNSNNYITGLENIGNTAAHRMHYSVNNKVVTVTADLDDGYGYINARVYLDANKTYVFNCDTNGTWGIGATNVEAFVTLVGQEGTWSHMASNENFEFKPKATGEYYVRLDVNAKGQTYNFSNIEIREKDEIKVTTYGETLGTLPSRSRNGFTFAGWYTAPVGGTQITSNTKVTESTTYYAHWTANNYTITYDQNYYEPNLWKDSTDLSVYKSWSTIPTSQTIIEDRNVLHGQIVKFVMPAGQQGGPYYFYDISNGKLTEGKQYTWSVYIKSNTNKALLIGSQQGGRKNVNVTNNWQKVTLTFTANATGNGTFSFYPATTNDAWSAGDELYIHSLEIMEGTPTHTTVTKAYGTNLGTLPAPTKAGYSFEGWYTAPTGGTLVNSMTTVPMANTTYYAHWRKTTANSYTATFNSNGGTTANPATIIKESGAQLGTLPTTSRINYTFAGWFTAASGGTQISTTTTMGTANVTYYAHWVANPSVAITKNPTAATVVAGNPFTFSVTATGNGTLSYQWYSATSSTAAGTAIAGATSATYTATSSSGLNGKYYYCVVTSKVDSSTKTATSGRALLTVQAANYSTVKSNVTTYYNTLATAIAGATSGGGDTGGGTITVLNNVTDNSAASTNKTIAINTNGKTLNRNTSVITTGGTLIIKGTGAIANSAGNEITLRGNGGNIIINDSPTIYSDAYKGIYTSKGSTGTLTINGGYVTSYNTAITIEGNGNVVINNAKVVSIGEGNGIAHRAASTGTITITGTSKIGNKGINKECGILETSQADLNIQGSSIISSWGNVIKRTGTGRINLTGACSLYAGGSEDVWGDGTKGYSAIALYAAGCTVTFNSTGDFFAAGPYVATAMENTATFNVTKGHFASRSNKYMFYKSSANVTSYVASETKVNKNFKLVYVDEVTTEVYKSCYSYNKGV